MEPAKDHPKAHRTVMLMGQGRVDYEVEAFEANGRLVIPCEEGAIYVTRQQAKDFFGLVELAPDTGV